MKTEDFNKACENIPVNIAVFTLKIPAAKKDRFLKHQLRTGREICWIRDDKFLCHGEVFQIPIGYVQFKEYSTFVCLAERISNLQKSNCISYTIV